ncbi:TfoX/Sxy family protein [Ruania alba]|uniref:Transcriptional regulator of competence genes, TfoX/Sxy family n=1 Tax=Ruania alba TaxID=648782 RepID=A0A1H5EDD0_9MICO|nr:TfoX/Sxy family protein [Ruania alba]SED89127.1 Transcriptional regulator of competence genes, TfoX/Sxy family [Ruania alba]
MTAQEELIERLRTALAGEASVREVSMFGGRSFMVHEAMIVSALQGGDLLVRVDAQQHEELLARPGASQAEMGAGRSMGRGWLSLSADVISDEQGLVFWLDAALTHNRSTARA